MRGPMRTNRRDAQRMDSVGMRRMPRDSARPAVGDRWITVPVPVQGEVILRYGYPPVDTAARAKSPATRDSVVVVPRTPPSSDSLRAQLAELEQRLMARIESMRQSPTVVMAAPTEQRVVIVDTTGNVRYRGVPITRRFSQLSSRDLKPFIGFSAGDAGTQAVLSLRMDLGPVSSGLQFVPEFAVGLGGDGTSVLAMANVQYQFGSFGGASALRPYITGGAGIFSPTVLGVNTAVGASVDLRRSQGASPWLGYVELQGLNLFHDTRVMFGVSIR